MSLSFRNPTQANRTNLWRNEVFKAPFNYGVEFKSRDIQELLYLGFRFVEGNQKSLWALSLIDRVNYIYKSNPRYHDFQNTPDDAINVLHDIKLALKTMCTSKQT